MYTIMLYYTYCEYIVRISKENKRTIEIARKYNLRLQTVKCEIFCYFEKGYKPREVRLLLQDYIVDRGDSISRNIYRYYYDWKKAQYNDEQRER